MNHSQRVHHSKPYRARTHRPTPISTPITQPRQSPITDIRTLTRLVFESYQHSYAHSSPKVQRRYRQLLRDLADRHVPG